MEKVGKWKQNNDSFKTKGILDSLVLVSESKFAFKACVVAKTGCAERCAEQKCVRYGRRVLSNPFLDFIISASSFPSISTSNYYIRSFSSIADTDRGWSRAHNSRIWRTQELATCFMADPCALYGACSIAGRPVLSS